MTRSSAHPLSPPCDTRRRGGAADAPSESSLGCSRKIRCHGKSPCVSTACCKRRPRLAERSNKQHPPDRQGFGRRLSPSRSDERARARLDQHEGTVESRRGSAFHSLAEGARHDDSRSRASQSPNEVVDFGVAGRRVPRRQDFTAPLAGARRSRRTASSPRFGAPLSTGALHGRKSTSPDRPLELDPDRRSPVRRTRSSC